jgi:hypothetical protein
MSLTRLRKEEVYQVLRTAMLSKNGARKQEHRFLKKATNQDKNRRRKNQVQLRMHGVFRGNDAQGGKDQNGRK